ncbi:MAG: FG-GAP repeat domain-containing protein [Verrucomicrobiia bacterium]|jgi:hypothetical protein
MTRILAALFLFGVSSVLLAAPPSVFHSFNRIELSDEYYAEGANFGDFNKDGKLDVVAGPFWYAGPTFKEKHEIYEPVVEDRNRYSYGSFFSFVYDLNGDGWLDVLGNGLPGRPAHYYENPGEKGGHWKKHTVFDWVSNESPTFTQLVGDDRPELVCTRQGVFGYVEVNWEAPEKPWTFRPISGAIASKQFGHGLGVGDINGDGRLDVIHKDGWFEQPKSPDKKWTAREHVFARRGGAQMFAYDVDGDGDNDVISSLAAHEHGLSWFEQVDADGKITFKEHRIMGVRPKDNKYGVSFSELHAMELHDMDGDGLKDIVTGKTYWSHHAKTTSWHDGAVVYWFKLVRGDEGAEFVPISADNNSGVGRQISIGDLNGDKLPDIIASNMKGTFVLLHDAKVVSSRAMIRMRPRPYSEPEEDPVGILPKSADGRELNLGFEDGSLKDWTATGDAFKGQPVEGEIRKDRKFAKSGKSFKTARPDGGFWIGSFEIAENDAGVGTLVSATFKVTSPFASFRIGGGAHPETRMELVLAESGRTILRSHGRNSETMFVETVDLTGFMGKEIFIRLVDEHTKGFGHLNFDDFRFHNGVPVFRNSVAMRKKARFGWEKF